VHPGTDVRDESSDPQAAKEPVAQRAPGRLRAQVQLLTAQEEINDQADQKRHCIGYPEAFWRSHADLPGLHQD